MIDSSVTPVAHLISAIFWGILLSCFLFALVEAPILFLLKRMQGKQPLMFALVAAFILFLLLVGDAIVGFLLLAFAGLERMGMGASDKGTEYIFAAQWIFLLILPLIFVARRGLLAAMKFRGNDAVWGYAFVSTAIIAVLLLVGKVLASLVPIMKG